MRGSACFCGAVWGRGLTSGVVHKSGLAHGEKWSASHWELRNLPKDGQPVAVDLSPAVTCSIRRFKVHDGCFIGSSESSTKARTSWNSPVKTQNLTRFSAALNGQGAAPGSSRSGRTFRFPLGSDNQNHFEDSFEYPDFLAV